MFGEKYSRLKFWIISIVLFCIEIPILIANDTFKNSGNMNLILIISSASILIFAIWINTLANRIRDYGDNPWVSLFSIIPFANIGLSLFYGISKSNIKEVTQKSDSNSLTSAVYNHSKDIINGIKPAINEYRETHTSPNNDSLNNNTNIDESKIYENIMLEIEQDNKVKSTWAKALSQSDGNKDKAESLYINFRVEELKKELVGDSESNHLNSDIKEKAEIKKDSSSKMIVLLIILISVLLLACITIFPLIYNTLNKDASTTISSSIQSDNNSIQNNNTSASNNENVSSSTNSITSKADTTNVKNKWQYKDWEIENVDDNYIKAFSINNDNDILYIAKDKKNCNYDYLYIKKNFLNKSIPINENDSIKLEIKANNEIFNLDTTVYRMVDWGYIKSGLLSSPIPINNIFIEKLKKSDSVQASIINFNEFKDSTKMEYSLNGFTKTYNVLNEACRDISALNRYEEVDKNISSNNTYSSDNISNQSDKGIYKADITDLVLNLTDLSGKEKLMKISFSIKSSEPTIAAIVEEYKANIIDVVISQISSRTSDELITVGGKNILKDDLLVGINNIINEVASEKTGLSKNNVKQILFTTYVIK